MTLNLTLDDASQRVGGDDHWIFTLAASMVEATPGLDALAAALGADVGASCTIPRHSLLEELQALRGAMVAELLHEGQIRIRNPDMLAAIVSRLSAKQPRLGRLAELIAFLDTSADTPEAVSATKV